MDKNKLAYRPTVKEVEEYMAALNLPEEPKELGKKYDNDKLRWSLLPLEALQDVVNVLEFGAKKYAPDNWKYVDNGKARYWDAAMRHMIAYKIDNQTDSETGLSHLAHAICCLLFLSHFDNEDNNK
jgi:hypothetical protein